MVLDDYLINDEILEDDILDLVDSKIPNLYFVAPLLNLSNDEFQDRKYYDLFSKVVILRGEEKIDDIYPLLFFWLKDFNLPGSLQIREFLIRSNKRKFMNGIYQSLLLAHDDNDDEWFGNLLSTLSERDNGPIGDLCEYMVDSDDYSDYDELMNMIEKNEDIKEYED